MSLPGRSGRRLRIAGICAILAVRPGSGQTAFRLDSGRPGPRVLVVGGIHGNEPSGAMAAEALLDGPVPRSGSLTVIPRANPEALAAGERAAPPGSGASVLDLNRVFPGTGAGPEARKAARIYAIALQAEVVVDLHEEGGAWLEADVPTLVVSPAASALALDLLERLRTREPFAFTGGAPAGSLVGELGMVGRKALVVEVPARLPLAERVAMHRRVLEALLRQLRLR